MKRGVTYNKRIDDPYTQRARKEGYLARSVYKLEEIDKKYHLFDANTSTVMDIGCAPGSWLQYASRQIATHIWSHSTHGKSHERTRDPIVLWCDLKPVKLDLPHVVTAVQDVTDREGVAALLATNHIEQFDVILSDMAPDTIGVADIDALKSVGLLEKTLWLYETYLAPHGKFAIKIFMWPGFEEFVREMKARYGGTNIVVFKPKACRGESKETYVIKRV